MVGTRGLACLIFWLPVWNLAAQPRSSKLLTFDIAAVDHRGKLVPHLRLEDFRVTDAGRRQEIVYFRRGQDTTAPAESLTREYSNYGYGTFPHATVILLDQLNALVELAGTEWEAIARALGRAEQERHAYFYVLMKDGALYPVHGLPDSWVEAEAQNGPGAREVLPLFEDMRKQFRGRPSVAPKRRQLMTETALQELATRLAAVPGPMAIVWVGPYGRNGKPAPPVDDPTGRIEEWTGEARDPVPIYYAAPVRSVSTPEDPRHTPPANPRVEQTIATAFTDAQRGYRIGYEPSVKNWDGRYHEVRITCVRPGIRVRAKGGYTAVRAIDIEDDRRQVIPDLLSLSPFDASTIRFRAAIEATGRPVQRFDLRVNAEDIFWQRSGNSFSASLAAQALQFLENGEHEISQDPLLVDLKLGQEDRDRAMRDGIPVRLETGPARGAAFFRIVVLDRNTQSFGTLTIPAGSSTR